MTVALAAGTAACGLWGVHGACVGEGRGGERERGKEEKKKEGEKAKERAKRLERASGMSFDELHYKINRVTAYFFGGKTYSHSELPAP